MKIWPFGGGFVGFIPPNHFPNEYFNARGSQVPVVLLNFLPIFQPYEVWFIPKLIVVAYGFCELAIELSKTNVFLRLERFGHVSPGSFEIVAAHAIRLIELYEERPIFGGFEEIVHSQLKYRARSALICGSCLHTQICNCGYISGLFR